MGNILEEVRQKLSRCFFTGGEFNAWIQKIVDDEENSLFGISYTIVKKIGESRKKYELGVKGKGEHTSYDKIRRGEDIELQIFVWDKAQNQDEHKKIIGELIEKFLNIENINFFSLLPDRQKLLAKCNETLKSWLGEKKKTAVFMLDLDRFKQVNDNFNHDAGSSVIREFGDILFEKGFQKAVILHQSGDEFNIMMPYEDPTELLALGFSIRQAAKSHNYALPVGKQIHLTAAQGVCLMEQTGTEFLEAVKKAEEAYFPKKKNREKYRDSVRLVLYEPGKPPIKEKANEKKMYVLMKTNNKNKGLFKNIFLDYICSFVSEKAEEQIQAEMDGLLEWMNLDYVGGQMRAIAKEETWDCSHQLSPEEVIFAVFCGLYNNPSFRNKRMILTINKDFMATIKLDEKEVFTLKETVAFEPGQLCETVVSNDSAVTDWEKRTKRTVLIYIGYDVIELPEKIFYRILRVDERPTTGGGLPDFWAGTLSELIGCVQENPYIDHVLICGKHDCASRLCSILNEIENWGKDLSYEFLIKKTNRRLGEIKDCQEKLHKTIQQIQFDEIVDVLYRCTQRNIPMEKRIVRKENWANKRFLNRHLSYEQICLDITDGCRVDYMAEAFPTVLEIMRNYLMEERRQKITDQAGRELIELDNFKLVINKPDSDDIPEYYRDEEQELDNYYKEVLGRENALFKSRLLEKNQLEAVLRHITGLFTENGIKYATRRAILVIEHRIDHVDNISPLGLVNIWIAPRQFGEDVIFDYTFSWRTVEAMVGLPFSLYATVKYAEELTEEISNRVKDKCETVHLGKVSYIANSLHMFLDPACLEIVRGVVNEATR